MLGMNLSGITSDTPAPFLIDRMRMAGEQTRTKTGSGGPIGPIDPVTGLNAGPGTIVRTIGIDPGKHDWVIRCDPNVSRVYLPVSGARPAKPVDGRMIVSAGDDWKNHATELSIDATGPVTRFEVVRADQEAALDAGEVFNPDYLAKVAPFPLLRALDHNATNYAFGSNGKAALPSKAPTDKARYFTTEKLGMAPELTAQLVSRNGQKLWNTVHIMEPDDMVLARLHALDANAGGSPIDLEDGNELFWSFHKAWVVAQTAAALNVSAPQYLDVLRWYGRRAGNLANMAASVSKRFKVNLSAQPVNGVPTKTLAAILQGWDESKAPRSLIAGFANGGYLNLNYPQANFDKVIACAQANDSAGFYALVSSLLEPLKARHAQLVQAAKAEGIPPKIYEENLSLTDFAPAITDATLRATVNAWVDPLIHSDPMADILMQLIQNATDVGIVEQCFFQLSGTTTQYGSWGAVPHVSLPGYPIYQRMVASLAPPPIAVQPSPLEAIRKSVADVLAQIDGMIAGA